MGEAYRGLTIRFGAETSNLKKALTTVNSAVKQTESMLRQVNRGLKFDPTSLSMLGIKAENTANKIGTLQHKIALLRKEESELANVKAVDQLAKSTENVTLRASMAKAKYAEIVDELAALRNKVKDLAKENNIAFNEKHVLSTINALKRNGAAVDELKADYKELLLAYKTAFDEHILSKNAAALQKNRLDQERFTAEVRQSARALLEMNLSLRNSGANSEVFKRIGEDVDHLRQVSGMLTSQLRSLQESMRLDSSNVMTANLHTKILGETIDASREMVEALNRQLAELGRQGFGKSTMSAKELAVAEKEASNEATNLLAREREIVTEIGIKQTAIRKLREARKAGDQEAEAAIRQEINGIINLRTELGGIRSHLSEVYAVLDKIRGENAFRDVSVEVSALMAKTEELERIVAGTGTTFGIANSKLKNLGITLQMAVSPALYQLGFRSVEAANKFDSSFRNMKKTVDGTADEFEHLKRAAVEFSETHITSSDTILEIEAMGGQLGIAVENLETFANVASNLDIATDMDAETIAQQMGQLSNIMHWTTDDMERYGDSLVRLGNNMPAQESAIANITMRIASMSSILGMSTADTLAWSAALAATGQGSEAAGTAFSRTMADIEAAVGQGGEAVEAFAQIAGMSADDLSRKWGDGKGGVTEVMKAFIEGLRDLDKDGESVTNKLDELGMSGVRQMQAVEGLTNTIKVLDNALTMSNDAWNGIDDTWGAAGDAAREAAQKSEGFSGSLGMLKNAASNLGSALGESVVPYMNIAKDAIIAIKSGFEALPAPVQSAVTGLLAFVAASGSALTIYSTASEVFGKSTRTITLAENAIGGLTATMTKGDNSGKKFVSNIKDLLSPTMSLQGAMVALAGIGIAGVVAAFADYNKRVGDVRKSTDGLQNSMLALGRSAKDSSSSISSSFGSFNTHAIDELIEKQAQLSTSIRERNTKAADSIAIMENYGKKMLDVSKVTDDNRDAVTDLEIAIGLFNDETGRNIKLVSDQAGGYKLFENNVELTTEAIYALIEAEKAEVVAKVAAENYKDLYKQEQENVKALAGAKSDLTRAQEEYNQALESGNGDLIKQAENNLARLQGRYESLQNAENASSNALKFAGEQMALAKEATEGNADAITKWLASNTMVQATLELNNQSLIGFRNHLKDAGVSASDLANIGEEKMSALASAYDGNLSSIIQLLRDYGVEIDEEKAKEVLANDEKKASAVMMAAVTSDALQSLSDALDNVGQKTDVTKEDVIAAFQTMADSMGIPVNELISHLNEGGVEVTDFMSLTKGELDKVVDAFKTGGEGASDALRAMSSNTNVEAGRIADYLRTLDSSNFPSETWGYDLASNFASGLNKGSSLISEKVRSIIDDVKNKLGHSIPKEGPLHNGGKGEIEWGLHLAENFAEGIDQGIPEIESKVIAISNMLSSNLSGLSYMPDVAKNAYAAARNVAVYATPQMNSSVSGNGGGGLTKADLYDVMSAVLSSQNNEQEVAIYMDSKKIASTLATPIDRELGRMSRRGRL